MAPRTTRKTVAEAAQTDEQNTAAADMAQTDQTDIKEEAAPTNIPQAADTATPHNYFTALNAIDVSRFIEKKRGLSYLSWARAWEAIKARHPDAYYTIYESEHGCLYFTDGRTCWVKTGVTLPHVASDGGDIEHIEYLPVMDYNNSSIPLDKVTSFDVNKAVQRSLTKACARHGIGLYVYAGEDLPTDPNEPAAKEAVAEAKQKKAKQDAEDPAADLKHRIAEKINKLIEGKTKEEKAAFAHSVIKPAIGIVNYNMCKDVSKLQALLDTLTGMAA